MVGHVQEEPLFLDEVMHTIQCDMVKLLHTEANVQARDINVSVLLS